MTEPTDEVIGILKRFDEWEQTYPYPGLQGLLDEIRKLQDRVARLEADVVYWRPR